MNVKNKPIKPKRRAKRKTPGQRIVDSLQELLDVLESGEPHDKHFTVRTYSIPAPAVFDARAVRQLRDRLGLSQGLFAQLVGVSKKLVEAWEAGTRTPAPVARRLLDAIARDPASFLRRTETSSAA